MTGAGKKPLIGIKYCGGCNPRYDRVAAVAAAKEKLGARYEFAWAEAGPLYDHVLVVCGCQVKCAHHADLKFSKEKYFTECAADFDRIVEELLKD